MKDVKIKFGKKALKENQEEYAGEDIKQIEKHKLCDSV